MYQSENFTECSCISQGCPEKQNQSEIGINFKELPGIIMGFPDSSVDKESTCNAGDTGSIPGSGRSPGEGNGNPLPVFFLENPMDRGAWAATVHGVTKNWTQLSNSTATTKIKLGKHIYF